MSDLGRDARAPGCCLALALLPRTRGRLLFVCSRAAFVCLLSCTALRRFSSWIYWVFPGFDGGFHATLIRADGFALTSEGNPEKPETWPARALIATTVEASNAQLVLSGATTSSVAYVARSESAGAGMEEGSFALRLSAEGSAEVLKRYTPPPLEGYIPPPSMLSLGDSTVKLHAGLLESSVIPPNEDGTPGECVRVFYPGGECVLPESLGEEMNLGAGPSFAYSLPMHPVHTRRDRVASLPPCCLYGAAIQSASPLGPGRGPDLAVRLE